MLSLLKTMTIRQLLLAEGPSLVIAMVVAEFLYKFKSFTLECLAFLATWVVVSAVVRLLGIPGKLPGRTQEA